MLIGLLVVLVVACACATSALLSGVDHWRGYVERCPFDPLFTKLAQDFADDDMRYALITLLVGLSSLVALIVLLLVEGCP